MYLPAGITNHEAAEFGYKCGVEAATEPDPVGDSLSELINVVLSRRRKTLLTKKVTKWVIVREASEFGCVSDPARQCEYNTADRLLYDSKESAEATSARYEETFGVFPVEIEVPL